MTRKDYFIDPTKPENKSRLLKYISDAIAQNVSSVREGPRPTTDGIENRNYYVSVAANGVDYKFVMRYSPEEIPEWRRDYDLYNLEREFQILQEFPSLSIGFTTPKAYGYDPGETFGVPCFLMEWLPGKGMTYHFNPSYDESLIYEYAQAVARVSTIAYKSNSWLKKNLPKWTLERTLEWFEWKSRRFKSDPLVHYAMSWLRERRPPSRPLVMCHGDPNPSNFLVENKHISGVIDWEFACLKDDPLDDLLCVGWLHDKHYGEELRELFCRVLGRDVEELEWFEARGLFGATYVNLEGQKNDPTKFQVIRQRLAESVGYKAMVSMV